MRRENEIYCNKCGKKNVLNGDISQMEVLHIEKTWGYFSGKDGENHEFDLCETCYDEFIKRFSIPVEIREEITLI